MIYKVDYYQRSEGSDHPRHRLVKNVADQVEATKKFMHWFFQENPTDAVKLTGLMELNFIGDLSSPEATEFFREIEADAL